MRATAMAEVSLQHVDKRFGETAAVRDLSLNIADGEFVVLLGPTGAGKTTTLRLVAGLEHPDKGDIWIDGRGMTRARRQPATSPSSFSNIRSTRISPCTTTSPSRCVRLRAACPRRKSANAYTRSPGCCISTPSLPTAPPASPAERCSASRSVGRSSDVPPSI